MKLDLSGVSAAATGSISEYANMGCNYGSEVTKSNYINYLTPIILKHHITAVTSFMFDKLEVALSMVYSFNIDEQNGATSGIDESLTAQLGRLSIDTELNSINMDATLLVLGVQFSYRF